MQLTSRRNRRNQKQAKGVALVRSQEQSSQSQIRSFGTIVYPWNSPIPVIQVEGDFHEMGVQFGAATRAIVRRSVEFNVPTLEKVLERSRVGREDYLRRVEDTISKRTEKGFLDELAGVAEAADVSYDDILLVNCNADIITTMPTPEDRERFFCSMFAAWGGATADRSSMVAGHNDDGARIMDQYAVLKVARPKRGFPFICPQVPGYLGYDCMVNASRLFFCGTAVDDRIKNSEAIYDGVPNWAVYRWIGQYASGVDDGIKRLQGARSMTIKNWCFISREEGGKVLEATPKHQAYVPPPGKTGDWLGVSTNTLCSNELDPYLAKVPHPSSGDYRCASVRREVEKRYGKIDLDAGIDILSSHYDSSRDREEPSEHTPCRHMEFENRFAGTCRSLVAAFGKDPSVTNVSVALGNPCYGHWRDLELGPGFEILGGYDAESGIERRLARILKML